MSLPHRFPSCGLAARILFARVRPPDPYTAEAKDDRVTRSGLPLASDLILDLAGELAGAVTVIC